MLLEGTGINRVMLSKNTMLPTSRLVVSNGVIQPNASGNPSFDVRSPPPLSVDPFQGPDHEEHYNSGEQHREAEPKRENHRFINKPVNKHAANDQRGPNQMI